MVEVDTTLKSNSKAFVCLHCGVLAQQHWDALGGSGLASHNVNLRVSRCSVCGGNTIWWKSQMLFPAGLVGPPPAVDMSEPVREVYEEARAAAVASPRAAAALLRVAVEMLINEVESGDGRMFEKIGKLVKRGLDPRIQKMLDAVCFYGNDGGAHPGEINLNEQPETVHMLMFCLNQVIEQMVTNPRRIDDFYETIPQSKRAAIERRDQSNV